LTQSCVEPDLQTQDPLKARNDCGSPRTFLCATERRPVDILGPRVPEQLHFRIDELLSGSLANVSFPTISVPPLHDHPSSTE
jgi:hypothetical protein